MTEENEEGNAGPDAPGAMPDLRLRNAPPRVTRLSRKVLAGLGFVSALAIAAALGYALQTQHGGGENKELYSTESHAAADGLANLPRDYTGVPRAVPQLGPPLPGDLGRPILNAQGQAPSEGTDAAEQRRQQEMEAARLSKLFAATEQQPGNLSAVLPATASTAAPGTTLAVPAEMPADAGSAQNMQDRKLAFLTGPADHRTVSADRLAKPASTYIIQAGTVIPAALITGIRSDLPGQITAQVTETVYDSPTGAFPLIPQGAKLIGQYDSSVAFGQSRVLLVWTRLIMPNGASIMLDRQSGADTQGFAGLEDDVDYHWWDLAKAAALSTLLGVGAGLGQTSQESDLVHALRQGSQDSISNTGQQIVRRQLNVQPTLTIRPGFPVRVIVNRDLILEPYRG